MSYTRSRGSTTYTTRTKTDNQEPVEVEDGIPKCSGHKRRCKEFTAGLKTKNPGRKFYTCPLGQSDPQRCNFFKWADDLPPTMTGGQKLGSASELIERVNERYNQPAQTLGRSPQPRYGKPVQTLGSATTPTSNRMMAPITPESTSRSGRIDEEKSEDEIDWDKVDTDSLEKDAIASTPGSSQRRAESLSSTGTNTTTLQERLLSAVPQTPSRGDVKGKRKRESDDEVDKTPKRAVMDSENPFLNSPGGINSPVHHALTPSLTNFEQLSAHLHRQDRLIRAGEVAKEGFRRTIQRQKDQIAALEKRIQELEQRK